MYKDSKWAKQIISLQKADGSWGYYHSLSQDSVLPLCTEQALRRLYHLGYTIEDECIKKAIDYLSDCLEGKNCIPDRKEKHKDWDIYVTLMLATFIRLFTDKNLVANKVAKTWANIITEAFKTGVYNQTDYEKAYYENLNLPPKMARTRDFANFYPVNLLVGVLDEKTENAMIKHLLQHENGIYYIYDKKLCEVPTVFASKETTHYLGAIEMLAKYKTAKNELQFVVEWLNQNKNANGKWDLGKDAKNKKIYLPLSDDWRKVGNRENDCTYRISKLLGKLS